jgi:putative protease
MNTKDFEIMSPVGCYESLMAAIQGGADSIYFGIEGLNMRSRSSNNFTLDDLRNIASVCGEHGVKSYLTVNTVIYDEDRPFMRKVIDASHQSGISAIIASDVAAMSYAREIGQEVHLSTQLNISNVEALAFYAQFADVAVLARELNLEQVRAIYDEITRRGIKGPRGELVRIEMFCHGALCMAVSGKCYLSLHEMNYSANRGSCMQICRRGYTVKDRESDIELDIDNQYIMSPKDLKTIHFINKMMDAGVRLFKIEGRARGPEYVRIVTACYKEAVQAYCEGTFTEEKIAAWDEQLKSVFNRGFWNGYYLGQRLGEWNHRYGSSATKQKEYVAKGVKYYNELQVAEFEMESGSLHVGDEVLITGPTTGALFVTVPEIRVELEPVEETVKGEHFSIKSTDKIRPSDRMYKLVNRLISASMLSVISLSATAKEPPTRPNIIFILTDDMGYGDVGVYGGKFVPTPNIDRLAAEGLQFMQYYSASPISSASRAGLLTGRCPGNWHITSYLQTRAGNRAAEMNDFLTPDAPTLPRTLQAAGYKTGHFGKWHLGGGRDVYDAPLITRYGYDEYVSTYESPDPDPLITATDWIWSAKDSIKRWNRTAYFVDKTLDFLRRNKGQPCFVNLWPDDMHTPWVGNFEQQQVFPDGEESEKNFRTVLIEYDRQIGRLIEGLKEMGLDRNTIVIFTSDNGPAPSFRGSRAGNYRGCKASLYEGGTRMPFIVWQTEPTATSRVEQTAPSLPLRPSISESIISALDIFPSLCRIAGVSLPPNWQGDGEDMSAALKGSPQQRTKPLYWEYRRNADKAFPQPADKDASPNTAIREGDWKLLINYDGSNMALYNLHDDPRETTNLAELYPEQASLLREKVMLWRRSLPSYKDYE